MALSVGHRTKKQGRTEAFWAVERVERYRLCAELVQVAGHLVIVCRSQADAARVASELSRHGVPAASVDHRDFAQPHVRAQVVTDETALMCARNGAACLVQFDPAAGPRRYRRRIDLLAAAQAFVVTFVVPERSGETRVLLDDLDLHDVIAGADLAVARRALALAVAAGGYGDSDGGPSDGGPSDGGPSDGGPSDGVVVDLDRGTIGLDSVARPRTPDAERASAEPSDGRVVLTSSSVSRASGPAISATAVFAQLRRLLARVASYVGFATQRLTRRGDRVTPIRASVADEASFSRGRQAS